MGVRESAELLPGTFDLLILRTLARGPQHGYAIASHLKTVSEGVLARERVEFGRLIVAIHKVLEAS